MLQTKSLAEKKFKKSSSANLICIFWTAPNLGGTNYTFHLEYGERKEGRGKSGVSKGVQGCSHIFVSGKL